MGGCLYRRPEPRLEHLQGHLHEIDFWAKTQGHGICGYSLEASPTGRPEVIDGNSSEHR
jgi:hypothetical protein